MNFPWPEFDYVPLGEITLRYVAAMVLALLLGLDREFKHKPIGFRPYMLVALGATSFVLVMMELTYTAFHLDEIVRIDPGRVMEGIIGGIGFLGAGALLHKERGVRGATTGAGIWLSGGIGVACGFGFYWHAAIVAALALIVMILGGITHKKIIEHKIGVDDPDEAAYTED